MRKAAQCNKACVMRWIGGSFRAHRRANSVANTLIYESRRLQFPLDTLVDALIELEDKQGHWPPKTTVVGAAIDTPGEDGEAAVTLSIHHADGSEVVARRYSLAMLAAAIVNYCVTMRVPMPRNSTKTIQVLADGVALVLENTVMLQTRHEELSTLAAGSLHSVPAADPITGETAPAASGSEPAGPVDGGHHVVESLEQGD